MHSAASCLVTSGRAHRGASCLALALAVVLGAASVSALPAHDPPASLLALDASIKARPNDPELYFQRGEVLLGVQAAADALADFDRVARLRADYPRLDLARGCALRALGRHDEALVAAARELERDPRCGAAAVLRARCAASIGQYETALRLWDAALAVTAPRQPEFYLERADAAVQAHAPIEAIAGLDRAMADIGPLITLQERAVVLCEQSGRWAEAVGRLDRLLRGVTRPETWLAWKARLLDRSGQPAPAAATRHAALAAIAGLSPARRQAPAVRALTVGLERAVLDAPYVPPAAILSALAASATAPAGPLGQPAPSASGPGSVLVPRGSVWRYLDTAVDLGTAWRAPAYDDSLWPSGLTQLGFGDGDENGLVNGGPTNQRTPTIYFRRAFNVVDPSAFTLAHTELLRDDGAVVYLNGTEIARHNMPSGAITFATLASQAVTGPDEGTYFPVAFPPGLLLAGTNVVAVEVHQASATSSDLSFDLELVATPTLSVQRGPYLQLGTSTSATVRWRTDAPSATGLWLGGSPGTLSLVSTNAQLATEHEVLLNGLTPSQRYYYAVGDGVQMLAGATADFFFVTSPPPGTAMPTRIWALGDSGTADANARAVRDAYLAFAGSRHTDLLLMLGDNAYSSGTDQEYQRAVFDTYPTILRNTFLWPTMGNHDGIMARSATLTGPYYDSFSLPAQGQAGGLASGTEAYYAFDYGQIHCVCLDSEGSDRSLSGAMLSWLNADLGNCTAEWVIVFFHHPAYTKGSHDSDSTSDSGGRMRDMRENALRVLEAHGVDLVLTGHSHSYERSYLLDGHYGVSSTLTPQMKLDRGDGRATGDGTYAKATPGLAAHQGAVHVVAGSSGSISGGSLNHPAHVVSLNRLGSLVVDVDGRRLDAAFVDSSSTVRDSFTIEKGVQRWLVRDEPAIAVATGGVQTLTLAAGTAHANEDYIVAGSFGTTPGFVRDGYLVPLNPDGWFSTTLSLANGPFFQNSVGRLDAVGGARASLVLPRLPSGLAGLELYHAFVVFSGGRVVGASNPVKLRLR